MDMNRRQLFRTNGAGLMGSALVAMGFSPTLALVETRHSNSPAPRKPAIPARIARWVAAS